MVRACLWIEICSVSDKFVCVAQDNGGIGYQEIANQTKGMNAEIARLVCREYKISCAEIILREDITVDQFIDVIEGNRSYIPVLYVFNKIDSVTIEELDILDQMPNYVPISSQHGWNLEELMEEIWKWVYIIVMCHELGFVPVNRERVSNSPLFSFKSLQYASYLHQTQG